MKYPLLWAAALTFGTAWAQKPPADGDNIVPNPGFERFANPPIGWTYKGADFGRVVKYWFSATTASPDVYGPGVHVPRDWAEKGFGDTKPHGGKAMAGLTLYGCINGKPHCREYIEVQLAEPLVNGQTYEISFWVAPMGKSMFINQIGAYFSVKPIERKTDEILVRTTQFQENAVIKPKAKEKWIQVKGTFTATYEAEHLLIGNFNDDATTTAEMSAPNGYTYAYYYVDDVRLRKVPPFLKPPVKPDDLTQIPMEPGQTIQLKDIYFEFDKDELMPRSYVELAKLARIMKERPSLWIEIVGHTDSIGGAAYNLDLSQRRAKAVQTYLFNQGIWIKRLRFRGEGESQPIAPNHSEEGRAINRRVEFVVLRK